MNVAKPLQIAAKMDLGSPLGGPWGTRSSRASGPQKFKFKFLNLNAGEWFLRFLIFNFRFFIEFFVKFWWLILSVIRTVSK